MRLFSRLSRAALALLAFISLTLAPAAALAQASAWTVIAGVAYSVTSLGTANNNNVAVTSQTITTTALCAPGSLVVLSGSMGNTTKTLSSVTDSASNTYTVLAEMPSNTNFISGFAYSVLGSTLPSGGSITLNWSGTSGANGVSSVAACVTDNIPTLPLDASNHTANGNAGTAASTVSTGVLAQAHEAIVGFVAANAGSQTFTCGGSFAVGAQYVGSVGQNIAICAQEVRATTSVSFTPSWTVSGSYTTDAVSFKLQ